MKNKKIKNHRMDTKIGTIEKVYGIDLGVRSDMKLKNYLKSRGFKSMGRALEKIEKKVSKR